MIALSWRQHHESAHVGPAMRRASRCSGVDVDLDARLTRKQAARLIGLPGATVGMWKARGLLDTDHDGLYRWGDVLTVERQTRRSPNSRRQLCYSGR